MKKVTLIIPDEFDKMLSIVVVGNARTVRKWLEQDKVRKIDHSMDKYKCLINRF